MEVVKVTTSTLINIAFAIAIIPFISFLLSYFFKKIASVLAIISSLLSFLFAIVVFLNTWQVQKLGFSVPWINAFNFKINFGILLNDLTVIMLLLISFIAFLVTIYSLSYMKHDRRKHAYFSFLSLFCSAMLFLVMADNLFLVYIFWELVGFSSYLLIGFWYKKHAASKAAKKAFIMNRIGDLGFLLGIIILLSQFHTVDIEILFGNQGIISSSFIKSDFWVAPFGKLPAHWQTIAGLCFFTGAVAKSAQFPLHTWLPDAMEGPTAVSSLIHAATMVAAGVFLLIRVFPLFNETVLYVITAIGLITAFMAATIAVTQNDIKKILAFSTVSQLGFMMVAIGVQDVSAAIFHLITHAFFKCLLFLAAGLVINQLHHLKEKENLNFDEQNINFMGGLKKYLPITTIVFFIAAMALCGLPFTSGYLSKDAILISVFEWAEIRGGIFWGLPLLLSVSAWLTTFYIFRLLFKVFFGELRLPQLLAIEIKKFPINEKDLVMKIPLMVLAVFCLSIFFAINPINLDSSWLYKAFILQKHNEGFYELMVPFYINSLNVILIFGTYQLYARKSFVINFQQTWLYKFSKNQWYFNELYQISIVNVIMIKAKLIYWFDVKIIDGFINFTSARTINLASFFTWIDEYIIDGIVSKTAWIIRKAGDTFKGLHTGKLQQYFAWMLFLFITFYLIKIFG